MVPEVDVASQGDTVEQAIENLKEALELHLARLSPDELEELHKRQGMRLTTAIELPVPA